MFYSEIMSIDIPFIMMHKCSRQYINYIERAKLWQFKGTMNELSTQISNNSVQFTRLQNIVVMLEHHESSQKLTNRGLETGRIMNIVIQIEAERLKMEHTWKKSVLDGKWMSIAIAQNDWFRYHVASNPPLDGLSFLSFFFSEGLNVFWFWRITFFFFFFHLQFFFSWLNYKKYS